jgi:hypothetical protein
MTIKQIKILFFSILLLTSGLLFVVKHIVAQPLTNFARIPLSASQTKPEIVGSEIALNDVRTLEVALKKPLFEPARSPFEAKPLAPPPVPEILSIVEPPPPQPQLPAAQVQFDLLIKGVFKSSVRDQVLVVSTEQPDGNWQTVGDIVAGWKIIKISEAGAKFEAAGQIRELKLYVDNTGNTLAPAEQPR